MNAIAADLKHIIENATERLQAIPESLTEASHIDGQWSAKQILGHLIDSAANNHQRFVRAQFTDDLVFQGYNQEQWIRVQHYDEELWTDLIDLWRGYNLHLAHVISQIPEDKLTQLRTAHTLDKIAWQTVSATEPTTLDYLIRDYLGHLQAHLEQLFAVAQAEQ
ncbi:MAG TPA: DinB family protein [Anaerolineae bacterium]|nr:DinB family protein [Anaerolineae bacterium]